MKVERGDVVLTRVPHAAGGRGKKRPAVVIQADHYNQSERFVIVAEITTNLTRVADPANLLVETATPRRQDHRPGSRLAGHVLATGNHQRGPDHHRHRQAVGGDAPPGKRLPEDDAGHPATEAGQAVPLSNPRSRFAKLRWAARG